MIVFARHGQTAPNRDGLVLGRADPELTEEGHRQAALLAAALAGEPVTAILTSPLLRARQTAEPVVAVSHVSPIKAAAAWAMGVDGTVAWRMFLALASITRVGQGRNSPVLLSFNETGHLHPVEDRKA
jgi:broad specificity phosphatase PhoE